MGPFSGRLRNALRRLILRRADALIVREEISQGYLRDQLGLEAEATLDSAFQNDIPADYLTQYDNIREILALIGQNRTIGLVATDLKWYPAYSQSGEMAARLTSTLLELTGDLLSRGYSIVLIPQLFGGAQAIDERRLLERITGLDSKRIQLLPSDIDSFGQQALIARLFCVISMRYHQVVFAAKAGIPFISVYYEHKAKGFAQKTGMGDFSIDVQDVTADEIIGRFVALEQSYDTLKDRLRTMAPILQQESRRTTAILVAGVRRIRWDVGTSHLIPG
jgi:polysaccharide pyruvyl transferase WcaK-like protein